MWWDWKFPATWSIGIVQYTVVELSKVTYITDYPSLYPNKQMSKFMIHMISQKAHNVIKLDWDQLDLPQNWWNLIMILEIKLTTNAVRCQHWGVEMLRLYFIKHNM